MHKGAPKNLYIPRPHTFQHGCVDIFDGRHLSWPGRRSIRFPLLPPTSGSIMSNIETSLPLHPPICSIYLFNSLVDGGGLRTFFFNLHHPAYKSIGFGRCAHPRK